MNAKTLKQMERAHYRILKITEAARRDNPKDVELLNLHTVASKEWNAWYDRLQQVEVAAAGKRDKGEVLFTIFYPDGKTALKSITRTPNRLITGYEVKPWYFDKPKEGLDHVQVRRSGEWKWDFQYHMRKSRESCDLERERKVA